MNSFLGHDRVADYLGISPETLTGHIQSGDFPPPDATIDVYPGWARATIDRWSAPAGHTLYCDSTKIAQIVTRIRSVAEDIRAHGCLPGSPGISNLVPRELYSLAGRIESELRRLVTTDRAAAKHFGDEINEADVELVTFDLPPALSRAVHPNLNLALGAPNLRRAAHELEVLAGELGDTLISGPSRNFPDGLHAIANVTHSYAAQSEERANPPQGSPGCQ